MVYLMHYVCVVQFYLQLNILSIVVNSSLTFCKALLVIRYGADRINAIARYTEFKHAAGNMFQR